MEIKECFDKEKWQKNEGNEFLQSWDWGDFQQSVGNKVLRLRGEDWRVQGFEQKLSFLGKYLYVPRVQISKFMVQDIIIYLKLASFVFVRFEFIGNTNELRAVNCELINNRQPQQTLILNLNQTEEQILFAMHPKTRYNIHLAEKKGIVVKQEKNIEVFWQLIQETAKRDEIRSHEKKYYAEMLKSDFCYQLTAYLAGRPIASNILIIYKDVCTYLHGASASAHRNLMAPYLLQWEGIKLAKKLNCQSYDFWGVAPLVKAGEGKTTCFHNYCWEVNHSWTGITRFKAGFGARYYEYPKAMEIVLDKKKYWVYKIARKILKIR